MKTVVLATGGFDPVHKGHIAYLQAARALGDVLVVGVNSDAWLTRKKGRSFMPLQERAEVLRAIQGVDFVIDFDDSDGSACRAIWMVRQSYPDARIIFANGGDRGADNIPEMHYQDSNIQFEFGVGGTDKKNSSSWILQEWKAPRTGRPWGYYRVLHEHGTTTKLKELVVDPGVCLSMQRHDARAEFWFVAQGQASVYTRQDETVEHVGFFNQFDHLHIQQGQWHRLCNETERPLHIIEIQYGDRCDEQDIERHA